MEKIAIVVCLHGDERYGLDVISSLNSHLPFFLGNPLALKKNKRFIDFDLNRSFPGKIAGNYEERIAYNLLKKLKDFDYIIDLHSSSNECPLFGIITKPNEDKIIFARKIGLKRIVIMPESFASGKALIDFVKCGISIEVGPHERKENISEIVNLINKFPNDKEDEIEIFEVIGVIKKQEGTILIKNFQPVKKGQVISEGKENQIAEFDFTPVLVNEKAYKDILCLACKKMDIDKIFKYNYHK